MSKMGGQNCHVDVGFDDGHIWIARIRLDDPTLPPESVQNHVFRSEVSTLKFLENAAVPAPAVYYDQLKGPNNSVGASFILMENIRGNALDWHKANKEQRRKILEQLADIFLEIERHPLDKTGSIIKQIR